MIVTLKESDCDSDVRPFQGRKNLPGRSGGLPRLLYWTLSASQSQPLTHAGGAGS